MRSMTPRTWALWLWTVAAIAVGIVIVATVKDAPQETCDYCWISAPSDQTILLGALFFAWLLGLLLIVIVAAIVGAVRHDREIRQFVKARQREPRRF